MKHVTVLVIPALFAFAFGCSDGGNLSSARQPASASSTTAGNPSSPSASSDATTVATGPSPQGVLNDPSSFGDSVLAGAFASAPQAAQNAAPASPAPAPGLSLDERQAAILTAFPGAKSVSTVDGGLGKYGVDAGNFCGGQACDALYEVDGVDAHGNQNANAKTFVGTKAPASADGAGLALDDGSSDCTTNGNLTTCENFPSPGDVINSLVNPATNNVIQSGTFGGLPASDVLTPGQGGTINYNGTICNYTCTGKGVASVQCDNGTSYPTFPAWAC